MSAVVAAVRTTRASAQVPLPDIFDDVHALIGVPVFGPSGEVFAVQVACSADTSTVGRGAPAVAGWEFEIRSPEHPLRTRWTSQFRQLYGVVSDVDAPTCRTK